MRGQVKPYQIRQVVELAEIHGLTLEIDDEAVKASSLKFWSAFGGTPAGALQEVLRAKDAWLAARDVRRPVPRPRYRPAIYQTVSRVSKSRLQQKLTGAQQNDIIVLGAGKDMIPEFRRDGMLPRGRHAAEWPEFSARFSRTPTRERLCVSLSEALRLLQAAGCRLAYVDGSFVSSKPEPGDFDVCWDITGVDADLVPPVFFEFGAGRAARKARFGGEFFPAQLPEGLSGRTLLDFFQRDRNGRSKGIIALDLESLP